MAETGAEAARPVIEDGKLALNVMYFARILRKAGLPLGPGTVLDAVEAVRIAGFGPRGDLHAILHAVFVKRHEHSILFDQAFALFWRRRGFMDKLMAAMSPMAEPKSAKTNRAEAGATRVHDAMGSSKREEKSSASPELSALMTVSAQERLQDKDFAQMSAAEIAETRALVSRLVLPRDEVASRRWSSHRRGSIDPRRSFRRSIRAGAAGIDLARRSPVLRHPPLVAICDISGSMADYTRIFLHFLHALTAQRRTVHSFLFGTRLTNVTRALRSKDVDDALALCGHGVKDWAGGTRIAPSLRLFNKDWSRRVLGQGASVILFTDGLERDGVGELAAEVDRLRRSCRRLIWVNPLLRFADFRAKAGGIRAMLPHVDEFRPIHNLRSMAELCRALGAAPPSAVDPKTWLRNAA